MTAAAFAQPGDATLMSWTIRDALAATGAQAHPGLRCDLSFLAVTTDSRAVPRDSLFFALRGPRYDAHAFVADALRAGAAAAVVDHPLPSVPAERLLVVPDVLRALGDLAAATRARYPVRVVGVTGSNGKTTTKEMIAAVCGAAAYEPPCTRVLKSTGNLNNLIGLPLTLLQLRGDEAVAVLEMGMNQPGEIGRLTDIARPDYAVVTNVGPVHLAGVGGTIEGVAAAKGELFAHLTRDAVIAVNVDDQWVQRIAANFPGRRVTFGRGATVTARAVTEHGTEGLSFDLMIEGRGARVRLPLLGRHNVDNALAAAAIGHALGHSMEVIVRGLETTAAVGMRLQVHRLANGVTIINDAYNANPSSVGAALAALTRLPGRHVVVLGSMRELGDESRRAHHQVGERAGSLGVDQLVLFGEEAEAMAEGARAAGLQSDRIQVCNSHAEAAAAVVARWQRGDMVLVKGSRGMQMEAVVRLLEGALEAP
jgi:UDP-N-acetylmuramoyl-tripeptide--D-alanyl-D-alanine ligase